MYVKGIGEYGFTPPPPPIPTPPPSPSAKPPMRSKRTGKARSGFLLNRLHSGDLLLFRSGGFRPRHFGNRHVVHNRRKNRPRFRLHRPPVHCGTNPQTALDLGVKVADHDHRHESIVPKPCMHCMQCMHFPTPNSHFGAQKRTGNTPITPLNTLRTALLQVILLILSRVCLHGSTHEKV